MANDRELIQGSIVNEDYFGDYHTELLEVAKDMLNYLVKLKDRCEEGGE